MSTETLRNDLLDTIEEMRKLLEVSEDADQLYELRLKIRELSRQADGLTNASLQAGTPTFDEAVASVHSLARSSREARDDLGKTAEAIGQAAKAVAKVEKLLRNIAPLV